MTRYCPRCGAVVPQNSLTCPQCYAEVPRDVPDEPEPGYSRKAFDRSGDEFREQIGRRKKSAMLALFLSVVPAFFGLLGLGLIYEDRRDPRGFKYLGAGLILFAVIVALIFTVHASGILGTVLFIIPTALLLLIYLGCALAAAAETWMGNLRIFGLRARGARIGICRGS